MNFVENKFRIVDIQETLTEDSLSPGEYITSGTYKIFDTDYYSSETDLIDTNPIGSGEIVLGRLHTYDVDVDNVHITVDGSNKGVLSGTVVEYFGILTPILDDDGFISGELSSHNSIGGYIKDERTYLNKYYEDLQEMKSKLDLIESYDNLLDIVVE
jgi:hypothetical protein